MNDPSPVPGSELLAAERTGTAGLAMEIVPVYFALRRWERFTYATAVRVDG